MIFGKKKEKKDPIKKMAGVSNQQQAILEYLWREGEITNRTGMLMLNVAKVDTRVSELRAKGWDLPMTWEKNMTNGGRHGVYHMSYDDAARYEREML